MHCLYLKFSNKVTTCTVYISDIDDCADDPCNGRPCTDLLGGYSCFCFSCKCLNSYHISDECFPGESNAPNKHETFTLCWVNVGPASKTVCQH